MGGKEKQKSSSSWETPKKKKNKTHSWSKSKRHAENGDKGKAVEKTQWSGSGALWNTLTSAPARFLSTIWFFVIWPFRCIFSIVYWIYQCLAFIVVWIYSVLASIAAWVCKLPVSFKTWLFGSSPSIPDDASYQLRFAPQDTQQRPKSPSKKKVDISQSIFERVGGTHPLTNQKKLQSSSVHSPVSEDTTHRPTLREAIEQLQEIERLKKELQHSKNESKEHQNENSRLKNESKEHQNENSRLKAQQKKLAEKIASVQAQEKKLDEKLASVQNESKEHQNENSILKNQTKRLQEDYAELQVQNAALRSTLAQARATIDEQKTRLSKMASERMRDNNTTVEDLNDPRRPTALISKWTSLFRCGEYWTAYQEIASAKGEPEAASTLYEICHVVYDIVAMYVDDLMAALQTGMTPSDLNATALTEDESIKQLLPEEEERENFLDSLRTLHSRLTKDDASGKHKTRKLIVDLLKSKHPPDSMTKRVDEALGQGVDFHPSLVKKFAEQLGQLIYYMRAQEIPMVVDFQGGEGATFDPFLYEVDGSTGTVDPRSVVIKDVIRPVVRRNESGPVLSKGEVEVMSRSQYRAKRQVARSSSRDVAVQTEDLANEAKTEYKKREEEQVPPDEGTLGAGIDNEQETEKISPAEESVAGSSSDAAVQPRDGSSEAVTEDKSETKEQLQHPEQEVAKSLSSVLQVQPSCLSTEEQKLTEEEVSQAPEESPGVPPMSAAEGQMKDSGVHSATSTPPGEGNCDNDNSFQERMTSSSGGRKLSYDMSDYADHPLPESDDDGEGNDRLERQDPDKKRNVKGDAEQTVSGMDGAPSSISRSVTQTSSTTAMTHEAEAIDVTPKEPRFDANSTKEKSTGSDQPARSIPEESPDRPSQCANSKADVEQTQEGNAFSSSAEIVDPNSSSETPAEETQSLEETGEEEINPQKLERCSEIPTGNTQETKKQMATQSTDGDHPELQGSPLTTLNEGRVLEGSNSDPEANDVDNADEPSAQDVDTNTEPENGQQIVEENISGRSQSPGVETEKFNDTAHSNVSSPPDDRPDIDDPESDLSCEETRDAENTKDSAKEKSQADTTRGTTSVLTKPPHATTPPKEISVEARKHSDSKAMPAGESSVIHESNQATSPDQNVNDLSESTEKNEDQLLEQSSPEFTTTISSTESSSLNKPCPASGTESQRKQILPELDDKGADDHTERSGSGDNLAAANVTIENDSATDQEPGEIPTVQTTPQSCHTEVSDTDGNDSAELSETEENNQPATQRPILNPEVQEGEEVRTQQGEQPSHEKTFSDPTREMPFLKESQAPSNKRNLSQELGPELGGSSDAHSNTLSVAGDQNADSETN